MSFDERDTDRLIDMLVYARIAVTFCEHVTWEQFRGDMKLQLAVERALQIVGEAASKVSQERRLLLPGVPWPRIIGLRHRLVHDYPRIELPKLWNTVQQHLNSLIDELQRVTPPQESG